jgi:hypothetical protein
MIFCKLCFQDLSAVKNDEVENGKQLDHEIVQIEADRLAGMSLDDEDKAAEGEATRLKKFSSHTHRLSYLPSMEEDQFIQLPEEVLLNILSYVDYPSRPKVVLVCKTLYNLICELEKDQFALELSWKQVNQNKNS